MDLATASPEALKAPLSPGVPEPPSLTFWNETQWTVFMALMDSIVPAIVSKSSLADKKGQLGMPDVEYSDVLKTARITAVEQGDEGSLKAFLEDRPSTNPPVRGCMVRVAARLSSMQREKLGGFLSGLTSSIGAFLMTGSCIPFHQQPAHVRESIIQGWHSSWFPTMRRVARSLVRIAQISWVMTAPIFREVTGYPEVPLNWKPGPGFDFKFLQFPARASAEPDSPPEDPPSATPTTIETDVVIVGSGCGGGVAASVLASAGHRVVVVDKGYYFPPSHLPMTGSAAANHLFDGAVVTSADGSVSVAAGATWGGGGTVNWSVSLQTQDFVREEWAAALGPEGGFFDGAEYQACMDRVCERMGVATAPVVQSHRGGALLDGSRRLGWRADVCPQNSGGREHSCGHCTAGCGSGEKQGPATSWLPDAARAGAEFVEGFEVERVLFEGGEGVDQRRAAGVVGRWTSRNETGGVGGPPKGKVVREVTIKAKRVIVACGAVWSPLVLMRSGLTNPNIGRNLHLHPCNTVGGYFPEETRPWEGAIITSYCSEFDNLDGQGHGVKLEPTSMIPYTCFTSIPWRSGLDFKLAALRYRHLAAYISVTRDRDSGRVYADSATGALQIEYTPSAFDRAHALEGVLALCKILYVAGAKEIRPWIQGLEPFVREDSTLLPEGEAGDEDQIIGKDPAFAAWLAKARRLGAVLGNAPCSSAHQMGTCRMSPSESEGVVDPRGKVWGTEGLYVADASVFPSASGVNPMVTVMAIADWIARAVDGDLKGMKQ